MIWSRRRKRVALAAGVAVMAAVFIVAVFGRLGERERERRRAEMEKAELAPPPPVEHVIRAGQARERRIFSAVLEPERLARVPAEVAGVVREVAVEPGQAVRTGQVLARLDDTRARLAWEAARARAEETRRLLVEAERLRASRVVAESALEAARAEARLQAALLAEAEDLVSRHVVRAPFDGFVNARLVEVGEAVAAYQAVAVVADLSALRVRFEAGEREALALPEGARVRVRIPALGAEAFEIPIVHAARSADAASGLFAREARLENPGARIPGGLRAEVEADIALHPSLPLVPAQAVRFEGGKAWVLRRAEDGGVQEVAIVVGMEAGGFYPVLEGLREGDRLLFR